jgi:signal recognition particle GTPase
MGEGSAKPPDMFESLSDRLQGVFRSLRGEARLTETTVEAALREIRMALLEADVNFKVVKAFIDRVRDRAVDQEVLKSLTPAQQVVRIVRDEMLALFGETAGAAAVAGASAGDPAARPSGIGQDDDAGKARRWLTKQGSIRFWSRPTSRRPAAIEQLNRRRQTGWRAASRSAGELDPVRRASGAMTEARTRLRYGDRRHRGPAAHRRRVDGRAAGDPGCGEPTDRLVCRGRDDRAGRDQERRRVQPPHRDQRRRAVEDGR